MPGTAAFLAGAVSEKPFNYTVFQAVEGDHDKTAAGFQYFFRGEQRASQFTQLIVDVNAQRLERAGGRMAAIDLATVEDARHALRQLRGARERLLVTLANDSAGDGAGFLSSPS